MTDKKVIKLPSIKIRNEQLIEAWPMIAALSNSAELPTATKWRITKLIYGHRNEIEQFDKVKGDLLPKYGVALPQTDEQKEQGAPIQYQLSVEAQKKIRAELAPILDEEIEINGWKLLGPADFGSVFDRITSAQILLMLPFVDLDAFENFADDDAPTLNVPGVVDAAIPQPE